MTRLELSVIDTTIWSVTLESSITIQEVSFTVIYDVYSTGISFNEQATDLNLMVAEPYSPTFH